VRRSSTPRVLSTIGDPSRREGKDHGPDHCARRSWVLPHCQRKGLTVTDSREGVWGLWIARRRLVVVLVGREGTPRKAIRSALTDDARFGLLEYLVAAGMDLVVSESLACVEPLPVQAVHRGLVVWTASDVIVAALLRAAAIRDPARAAALLGRLPAISMLRGFLRRLSLPETDPRQLPFLGLSR